MPRQDGGLRVRVIAIAVRLSDADTPLAAMDANMPRGLRDAGASPLSIITVIGGTSLMGGSGRIIGTLIGALIMCVLRNGLNLLGISSFIQQTVIGSVIILAVLMDMALKKQRT